jgi:hypothetical protein
MVTPSRGIQRGWDSGGLAFGREDSEAPVVLAFAWNGRGRSAWPAGRAARRRCPRDLPGTSRRPSVGRGMPDGECPEFMRKAMKSDDTVR